MKLGKIYNFFSAYAQCLTNKVLKVLEVDRNNSSSSSSKHDNSTDFLDSVAISHFSRQHSLYVQS